MWTPAVGRFDRRIIMKRCFSLLILFFLTIRLFAQNTDLKYYSDLTKDFSGYAVAIYYGNIKEIDENATEEEFLDFIEEELSDKLTQINKLTKKNNWLYKQALEEWEYSKGEVYGVICAESKYAQDGILLFVVVKGKNDFLWCAYSINDDTDFENIFEEK